jgi:hypothetical protein
MRAIGTLPVRRRYRLKDLNAPDPADENPVRIGRKDHLHGAVSGSEDRTPHKIAQRGDDFPIGAPHAGVHLQGAQAEIEENGGAIGCTQRIGVESDFGEDRPCAHGTSLLGETERHALVPGARGKRLGSNRTKVCPRLNANTAAHGHG